MRRHEPLPPFGLGFVITVVMVIVAALLAVVLL